MRSYKVILESKLNNFMTPETRIIGYEKAYQSLDFLGNQVRVAYAEFLQREEFLPQGVKEKLNRFYSKLDKCQQLAKTGKDVSSEEIAKRKAEAEELIATINLGGLPDYAFRA